MRRPSIPVIGLAVCTVFAAGAASGYPAVEATGGAQLIFSAGSGDGVVVNNGGVFLTHDDGTHWLNVTPPSMRTQPILLSHTFGIDAVGGDRVWLFVSANAGYGARLVYTWNAGRTWRTTPLVRGPSGALQSFLPGDANPSTPMFLTADDGWIVADSGSGSSGGLFRTRDGGAHWSFVAKTPFRGSVEFTTIGDGWAITAPTWTNAGTVKKDGGVLYHSTDGGLTWHKVALPPLFNRRDTPATFALPTFFSPSDGVLAGRVYDTGTSVQPVVVYTTHNGGATWHGELTPQSESTRRYQQGFFSVPFAASSPRHWAMYAGSTLYTTVDAGRKWAATRPSLPKTVAAVDHLYSAPAEAMWAQANGHIGNFYPTYLLRSADGGRTWSPLTP